MSAKRSAFYVVRVGGRASDTHAARRLRDAFEIAGPDDGDKVEVKRVYADDAGWARLARGGHWRTLKRKRNPMARRRTRRNALVSRYTGASTALGIWNPRRKPRKVRRLSTSASAKRLRRFRAMWASRSRRNTWCPAINGRGRRSRKGTKRSRAAILGWRRKRARGGRKLARTSRRRSHRGRRRSRR